MLNRFASRSGILDLPAMIDAGSACDPAPAHPRTRTDDPGPVRSHGGNQQKVLFAKWLGTNPRVFIMDEPTIGIDVGSKAEIRDQIRAIARPASGVILITAEIDELTHALRPRPDHVSRPASLPNFRRRHRPRQTILQTSVSGELAA